MTNELKPALRAELWAYYLDPENTHMLRDPCIESDEDAIANIAMLHASLADDSPYKITRDDVRCLEVAAQSALGEGDQVLRIAAKIAALLPH